jgi:hypothetical protein
MIVVIGRARPTTTIIELHQFNGPHKSNMLSVHNQMLAQGSTTNGPQSTQVRATTLELQISKKPLPILPIQRCFAFA